MNSSFNDSSFKDFVVGHNHPCLMAQAAVRRDSVESINCGSFNESKAVHKLYAALLLFTKDAGEKSPYRSYVAYFEDERDDLSEVDFEKKLWTLLQRLHDIDNYAWDESVSSDPRNAEFSFSLGGKSFYIIGMHPQSSRIARRSPVPTVVFNLHSQFDKLRKAGVYEDVRDEIRRRDIRLQGNRNPMVADFGTKSEARQYSGKVVGDSWQCPFSVSRKV